MQSPSSTSELTGIPTFTITPYGILAHLPVIRTSRVSIAVLYSAQDDVQLGLHLQSCSHSIDPLRPLYHLSQTRFPSSNDSNVETNVRLIGFSETRSASTFRMFGEEVTAEWKTIYLINRPQASASLPPRIPMNRSVSTPFRLSRGLVEELQQNADVPLLPHSIQSGAMLQFPWKGSPPATLQFSVKVGERRNWFSGDSDIQYGIVEVHLGCCNRGSQSSSGRHPRGFGKHWANIRLALDADSPFTSGVVDTRQVASSHDCSEDHIDDWLSNPKVFTLSVMGKVVEMGLSLTPCRMNSEITLDVNIKATLRS